MELRLGSKKAATIVGSPVARHTPLTVADVVVPLLQVTTEKLQAGSRSNRGGDESGGEDRGVGERADKYSRGKACRGKAGRQGPVVLL